MSPSSARATTLATLRSRLRRVWKEENADAIREKKERKPELRRSRTDALMGEIGRARNKSPPPQQSVDNDVSSLVHDVAELKSGMGLLLSEMAAIRSALRGQPSPQSRPPSRGPSGTTSRPSATASRKASGQASGASNGASGPSDHPSEACTPEWTGE